MLLCLMVLSLTASYSQENQSSKRLEAIVRSYKMIKDIPSDFEQIDESEKELADEYGFLFNKDKTNCFIIPYEIDVSFTNKNIVNGDIDMFNLQIIDSEGVEYEFDVDSRYSYSGHYDGNVIYNNSLIVKGLPPKGSLKVSGTVGILLYEDPKKGEEYSVVDYNGKTFEYDDVKLYMYTKEVDGETRVVLRVPKEAGDLDYRLVDKNHDNIDDVWGCECIEDGYVDYETTVPKDKFDEASFSFKSRINVEQISVPIDATLQVGLEEEQ